MSDTTQILKDDVGLVDFALVKGVDKKIRLDFSAEESINVSTWDFSLFFYIGSDMVQTLIISSDDGITANQTDKYIELNFTEAALADIPEANHYYDLRYDSGTGKGQIIKGRAKISMV